LLVLYRRRWHTTLSLFPTLVSHKQHLQILWQY
jgi:hypothetical protein